MLVIMSSCLGERRGEEGEREGVKVNGVKFKMRRIEKERM